MNATVDDIDHALGSLHFEPTDLDDRTAVQAMGSLMGVVAVANGFLSQPDAFDTLAAHVQASDQANHGIAPSDALTGSLIEKVQKKLAEWVRDLQKALAAIAKAARAATFSVGLTGLLLSIEVTFPA